MPTSLNRRSFLSASLLALCVPSKLFAEDGSQEIVLRFAALSDVHYDISHNDRSAERVRFGKALRFMNEYCASQPYDKFDALVVAGDFSNHGLIEEIGAFKKTMDDNLAPSTRRILAMGNHEYYGGNRDLWEKTFETKANRLQELNGYRFITVSPEKGTCNENDYVYLREWLDEKIQEALAADPTKPIFVVQHYHVFETVYGSASKPGDFHAGVKDFSDILERYPQVVHISGHSHIPSYDPRSVWQGKFTAIGTGSLSYFALSLYERGDNFRLGNNVAFREAGAFLIFDVYKDNTIRIRLYDVVSDSFLDREYLLVDPVNVDKYVYTNKRFDVAKPPIWKENASAEIVEVAPGGATIRFSQAKDEFCVVSYRIAAEKENEGKWEPCQTLNVWSDYFMKTPVEKIDYDVLNLEPNTKYRFNVYGVGAFQKETSEPLKIEFQTPDVAENVDRSNPNPRGNFLDVEFDPEKGAVNVGGVDDASARLKKFGKPEIVSDATLGAAIALNGVDQCYFAPFSGIRAGMFGNEITTLVKFRLDLSKKTNKEPISIFGSTESGGTGFEYYAEEKKIMVRCWIDDKYFDLTAPFDGTEDAVAAFVYDGKEARLYLNGKLAANAEVSGSFRFTNNASARAFCVGADVCPDMGARWFFPGVIANARVYTYALTSEQIENVSK